MGKLVAVEIANVQTRIGIIDSHQLNESKPGMVPDFEKLGGLRTDLGEMILNDSLTDSVGDLIERMTLDCVDQIEGIGIGISGAVDMLNYVHFTHLSGGKTDVQLDFRPFLKKLSNQFTTANITLRNRSNLGAKGEYEKGWRPVLKPNSDDLLFITVGGNIGVGIIANGEILHGLKGLAGECGHLVVDNTTQGLEVCEVCNQTGCASKLASGRALVNYVLNNRDKYRAQDGLDGIRAEAAGAQGSSPTVDVGFRTEFDDNGSRKEINARSVLSAASRGCKLALDAVEAMSIPLGKFITELAYILDPSIVVLGGIANTYQGLAGMIERHIKLRPYAINDHELKTSALDDNATLYGAALSVAKDSEKRDAEPTTA